MEALCRLFGKSRHAYYDRKYHFKTVYQDEIVVLDMVAQVRREQGEYSAPDELVMHLSFRDVWLDYFIARQHLVAALRCGDTLVIAGDEYRNAGGLSVIKFSSKFLNVIEAQMQKGYILRKAKVNFIVYWQKEGVDSEIQVILPEVCFEKRVVS